MHNEERVSMELKPILLFLLAQILNQCNGDFCDGDTVYHPNSIAYSMLLAGSSRPHLC